MSAAATALEALLSPLREIHLVDLMERMERASRAGALVTPEPWRRGPDGKAVRGDALNLPSRHDFEAETDGRILHPRVETPLPPTLAVGFAPVAAGAPTGASLLIRPFRWEAAELVLEASAGPPDLAPLRRWFLEFSQASQSMEAPELLGVLHALGAPRPAAGGVALRIDFGSAPIAAIAALVEALSEAGVMRARLEMAAE